MRKNRLYKNILIVSICIGLLGTMTGCKLDNKKTDKGGAVEVAATTEDSNPTIAVQTTGTTTEDNKVEDDTTEATDTTTDTQAPANEQVYTLEDINALTPGTDGWTETDWISWANDLHQKASEIYFSNEVGSNFWVNGSESITVEGMDYYLCDNYSSKAEATADFYSIFSEIMYADFFDSLLVEQDGKLYVIPIGRGSDVYYRYSQVVSLDKISENSISFTVEDFYIDPEYLEAEDLDNHLYKETREFTVVFENRIWKVGSFVIPY